LRRCRRPYGPALRRIVGEAAQNTLRSIVRFWHWLGLQRRRILCAPNVRIGPLAQGHASAALTTCRICSRLRLFHTAIHERPVSVLPVSFPGFNRVKDAPQEDGKDDAPNGQLTERKETQREAQERDASSQQRFQINRPVTTKVSMDSAPIRGTHSARFQDPEIAEEMNRRPPYRQSRI